MSSNYEIPDPREIPLERWVGELCLLDPSVPFIEGVDWQRWASSLNAVSAIAEHDIPNPYSFQNWREWAIALKQALG